MGAFLVLIVALGWAISQYFGNPAILYGAFFLALFVAIPFPLTGVWSGCVAAILFGIKPKFAIPSILVGMMIAGLLVLAATQGIRFVL